MEYSTTQIVSDVSKLGVRDCLILGSMALISLGSLIWLYRMRREYNESCDAQEKLDGRGRLSDLEE